MFFRNLGLPMQFSHGSVVQEDQTIYMFSFLKWTKNIRFQVQTDTGVNGNFTLKFYICFRVSCFVSKSFQTVREWSIKKVRKKKRRKETSILEQYTRLSDYFAHP